VSISVALGERWLLFFQPTGRGAVIGKSPGKERKMGWDVMGFAVGERNGAARVFNYEIAFTGSHNQPECLWRGDGVVLNAGRVMFNRMDDLRVLVAEAGANPQDVLDLLTSWVLTRTRETELRRA
jgi:hypothetical protein